MPHFHASFSLKYRETGKVPTATAGCFRSYSIILAYCESRGTSSGKDSLGTTTTRNRAVRFPSIGNKWEGR